jgi:multiple sugar transport system substrate-binding protein
MHVNNKRSSANPGEDTMAMMKRRTFLAGALAGASVTGLGGNAQAQAGTRIRAYWWGNPERDRRTRAVLDAYQAKNATVQVSSESVGWGDYWTKLATQTAGGNPPDLIQMDYRYIYEYSRRGTLLALETQAKALDMSGFSAGARDAGMVDGKLYGVTMGTNSKAMVYDVAMFEKVGVSKVDANFTWDEMARVAAEISKVNPGKYWGTGDNSRWEQGFEHWLNQRGKLLYTPDGKAAFTPADVTEWFDLWDKLRKSGACAPAEVAALNTGSIDQYEISRGVAAMSYANSNQNVAFQAINKNKLGISLFPQQKGMVSGHYIKPAMLMSISSKSRSPEDAARLVNFMMNEAEGAKILGIERGVPGSAAMQAVLGPDLDDLGKAQVSFVAEATKVAVPIPPPPPKGAGEIEVLLRRVADSVAFGRANVKDGATQFHQEAVAVLARG